MWRAAFLLLLVPLYSFALDAFQFGFPGGEATGAAVTFSETSPGDEGTTYTVGGRSSTTHDHSLRVAVEYVAGPWAARGDTSFVAKYASDTDNGQTIITSKLVDFMGLYQGDTLTVTVSVCGADADTSVVLDTVSKQYIIDHGVETWVFAPSWLASSSSGDYPAAGAIDHLVQDGGDGSKWLHGEAEAADDAGWGTEYSFSRWRMRTFDEEQYMTTNSQVWNSFIAVPFDSIPAGCEIVSAKIHLFNRSAFTESVDDATDGAYAVLDTFAVDWAGISSCDPNASYNQIALPSWNGPCPAAGDSASWEGGSLWQRQYIHDYGITDFDGTVDSWTDQTWTSVDLKDLVQIHRMMDYGRLPVWFFFQTDGAALFQFEAGSSGAAANQPFIVVRAKPDKQYANIWGDGVIVPVAFSSDDQYAGSNIAWQEVLEAEANTGVTIFVRGDAYDPINYASANHLTEAQLDSINQAGADVLGHSLYHGGDVNGYSPNCGSYSFISDWTTGVPGDSLYDDLSHTWLSTIIGETVTGMAWPRHIYSLDLWEYARDSGMLWARDGTNEQFGDCGAVTTAGVDAGEPTYVRTDGTPVAMYALKLDAEGSPGWYAPWDNGAAADAVAVDSTTVAERIRFCIGRATWQGRRPVMLFTHDIRGGNYTAAEGLSAGELEDMIQATPSGAKWMTMSDIMTKFISGSVACDPPAGSASATYGHTASDALWRKVQ